LAPFGRGQYGLVGGFEVARFQAGVVEPAGDGPGAFVEEVEEVERGEGERFQVEPAAGHLALQVVAVR